MLFKISENCRSGLRKATIASRTILFTLMLIVFGVRNSNAQDAVGNLEGLVSDKSGAPVVGASITLKNLETNSVRTQVSNAEGRYRFVSLNVGRYSLMADAATFAHFSQSPIEI